jgi:predicted enzyme related to lactoylglutathione lyase
MEESMSAVRFGAVSLDCPNPHELAAFYAELLETDIAFDSQDFSAVKTGNIWISLQRVDDFKPPTWPDNSVPQQLHLDFAVDDLDESEKTAVAAGARKVENQPSPDRWRVMLDPAGHTFCLSAMIPE